MKTIKQGGLYRYYKNDQDWAVVMADFGGVNKFKGQVLAQSKKCSVSTYTEEEAYKGLCNWFYISDFTYLPNCELSFVCKPKNPKKEKELVVEGQYYFETTKGKKR